MKTSIKLASRTYRAFENETGSFENRKATGVVLENGSFYQVYPIRKEFYSFAAWKKYCLKSYKNCIIEGAEENYYNYRMEFSSQSGDAEPESELGKYDKELKEKMQIYWKNIQKRPYAKALRIRKSAI